jgi:excisionase family DNA binding protein
MKALALTAPISPPAASRSEIISVPDACEFLSVHRNTLYKLITEGEIPAFRLSKGGRWKFRRSDLENWLSDRQARRVR